MQLLFRNNNELFLLLKMLYHDLPAERAYPTDLAEADPPQPNRPAARLKACIYRSPEHRSKIVICALPKVDGDVKLIS